MIFWDEDVNFNEQVIETQDAVFMAMSTEPVAIESEPCGEGFTRNVSEVYKIDDSLSVKITYLYANDADSPAWAALKNFFITKWLNDNGA